MFEDCVENMTLESFLVSTDKLQMVDMSSGCNGFRRPELEGVEDRHHGRRTDILVQKLPVFQVHYFIKVMQSNAFHMMHTTPGKEGHHLDCSSGPSRTPPPTLVYMQPFP